MNEANAASNTNDVAGFERARAAAEKAIALAPQLAAGYRARADISLLTLDFPGARADATASMDLAPDDTRVQNDYGFMLGTFGRLDEAIAATNKAIELDPLSSGAWANLGLYLMARQEFPAARRAMARSLAISPDDELTHSNLGLLDIFEGRTEDASREFNTTDDTFGQSMVEHARHHEVASRRALEKLITTHAADAAYQIAEVYGWIGEKDKAFEWLERAYQQRESGIDQITFDLCFTSLRSDPRYSAMLKRLGLTD
jgi:tetratricopeptide (TPR) repeat protein